jgi:hypothetical protein
MYATLLVTLVHTCDLMCGLTCNKLHVTICALLAYMQHYVHTCDPTYVHATLHVTLYVYMRLYVRVCDPTCVYATLHVTLCAYM